MKRVVQLSDVAHNQVVNGILGLYLAASYLEECGEESVSVGLNGTEVTIEATKKGLVNVLDVLFEAKEITYPRKSKPTDAQSEDKKAKKPPKKYFRKVLSVSDNGKETVVYETSELMHTLMFLPADARPIFSGTLKYITRNSGKTPAFLSRSSRTYTNCMERKDLEVLADWFFSDKISNLPGTSIVGGAAYSIDGAPTKGPDWQKFLLLFSVAGSFPYELHISGKKKNRYTRNKLYVSCFPIFPVLTQRIADLHLQQISSVYNSKGHLISSPGQAVISSDLDFARFLEKKKLEGGFSYQVVVSALGQVLDTKLDTITSVSEMIGDRKVDRFLVEYAAYINSRDVQDVVPAHDKLVVDSLICGRDVVKAIDKLICSEMTGGLFKDSDPDPGVRSERRMVRKSLRSVSMAVEKSQGEEFVHLKNTIKEIIHHHAKIKAEKHGGSEINKVDAYNTFVNKTFYAIKRCKNRNQFQELFVSMFGNLQGLSYKLKIVPENIPWASGERTAEQDRLVGEETSSRIDELCRHMIDNPSIVRTAALASILSITSYRGRSSNNQESQEG